MRLRRALVLGVILTGTVMGVSSPALAADAPSARGAWGWPVPPGDRAVANGFAPPDRPWLPGHRGVDLRGRPGEVVRAARAGRVHFAGRIGAIWVVSVMHADGLLTTYEPVRPRVRAGAWVRRGQPIGRLLRVGSHCLPACLHWGLRRGSAYLDPLALVGAARVRLLPLYPPDGPLPLPTGLALAAGVVLVGGLRPAQQAIRPHRRSP